MTVFRKGQEADPIATVDDACGSDRLQRLVVQSERGCLVVPEGRRRLARLDLDYPDRGGRSEGRRRWRSPCAGVLDDGDGRMLLQIVGSDNGVDCLIVRLVDSHDGKVVREVNDAPKMIAKVRNLWGSCRRKPCEG